MKKRKTMTRLQAWRFIKSRFEIAAREIVWPSDKYVYTGLCYAVRILAIRGRISWSMKSKMDEDIKWIGKRIRAYIRNYFWPTECLGVMPRIAAIDKILKKKGKS